MFHKIVAVSICFFIVFSTFPLVLSITRPADSTKQISRSFFFSNPSIQVIDTASSFMISCENTTGYLLNPGKPIMPIAYTVFTFPYKTTIQKISCIPSDISYINLSKNPILCPLPNSDSKSSPIITILSSLALFPQKEKTYPQNWYSYRIGKGIRNNERVLFLSIGMYPLRYREGKNTFMHANTFNITISYEPEKQKASSQQQYDMLIIAPTLFSKEIQRFITYRNTTKNIQYASLNEIPSRGRDRQEDIKYYIKESIESFNITHVLLIGDDTLLPTRLVHIEEPRSIVMGETDFISDLYYADIYSADGSFCNWDSNNNNIFGEYKLFHRLPSDTLDLYPDVYLGRLPCQSIQELSTYINKTIAYESNTSSSDAWFQRIIAIGADTFTEDLLSINEGERNTDAILNIMQGFQQVKLWGTNKKLQYASDITDAIHQGAGFVCFEGHAGSNSYRTHPQGSGNLWIPEEWYRTYHINQLTNQEKLPIITINACNTCKFSVDTSCFCWSFLTNPNGGGIASLGMTCLSWIYPGIFCSYGLGGRIHSNFYHAFIQGQQTFGSCWTESIIHYLNEHPFSMNAYDYKTIESWQPFGDPSLHIIH